MDTKETLIQTPSSSHKFLGLRKFPIVGLITVLVASAAFYLSHAHDQKVWHELFDYHSKHLLQIEMPLYQDFYNKRLQIDKIGSEDKLIRIEEAIQSKENKKLTRFILSDRHFRIFLTKKAPIYFSPEESKYWNAHNTFIKQRLDSLSSYHFAVIPERFKESPKVTQLLSYIFIDQNVLNISSNIVLLFLLCIMIERYIKSAYLAGFIVSFSLIYASLFLSIAYSFSSPLFGLNALLYMLIAVSTSVFIQTHFRARFKGQKHFIVIGISLFSLKLAHDIVYQTLTKEGLILLLPLSFLGIVTAQKIYQFSSRTHTNHSSEEQTSLPSLSEPTRASYAEALKGLSRFNFKYARQRLRLLVEEQPDSQPILESSYHLEKLTPADGNFGKLAQHRIDEALLKQDYMTMQSIFHDIQQSAPNRDAAKTYISADYYLKILVLFINNNAIDEAEHVFMFLELAGKKVLVQEACKLLIESFTEKQLLEKKEHYQALYQNYLVDP